MNAPPLRRLAATLLLPVAAGRAGGAAEPFSLPLEGEHAFRTGDDPRWADPDFDDFDWKRVPVPGTWRSYGSGYYDALGWYRIRFHLPADHPADLAVRFGELGICSDEVYLNGVKIGGRGRIARDGFDVAPAGRVYELPPEVLRSGRENLIAVRMARSMDASGIRAGPVEIGLNYPLQLSRIDAEKWASMFEMMALTTVLAGSVMIGLFLFVEGWSREPVALLALFLSTGAVIFGYSHLVEALGFAGHVLFWRIGSLVSGLYIASYLWYLRVVLGCALGWVGKSILILTTLVCGTLVLLPDWANPYLTGHLMPLGPVFDGLIVLLLGYSLYHFVAAIIRREPGVKLIFAAVLILIVGFAISFGEILRIFGQPMPSSNYSVPVLIVAFVVGLLAASGFRYLAARARIVQLSEKVLRVQDSERKRVARDLHDGAAQTLEALKLQAQRLDRDHGSDLPRLGGFVGVLADTAEEVRRTARALRPRYLETLGLREAMEWHGRQISGELTLTILFGRGFREDHLHPEVKENLFRIFQEALSNAVKHGGATVFSVDLSLPPAAGGRLAGILKDNGTGFDPAGSESEGIGLSTMRERAESLGGWLRIERERGLAASGMVIRFELPCDPGKDRV